MSDNSDLLEDVLAMMKHLSPQELVKVADEANICPFDCDSCHDEDCPCERLGCAGSEAPGAR